MVKEALDGVEEAIKVGGRTVNEDRFADDQGMVANTEAGLQEIMDRLVTTAKTYDMKIDVKKTKVMKVSRKGDSIVNILIEGQKVEQMATFKYLGSIMEGA